MELEDQQPATIVQDESSELEREESKSPVQEFEEDSFIKVELKNGLEELNKTLKNGESKEIRCAYTNLTKTFPTANLIWYSWAQYEYINGNFDELEGLFTKCLKNNLSVPLWKLYLSYVRNHQLPNISDESEARQTMLKAYDFAVGHIGLDVASGPIWVEYIEFTQSNYYKLVNEKISNWEQQQLMDLTRKIYHRALLNPMEGLELLWHAYDSYENSLNKLTAKKLVTEKSSGYMAARSGTKELLDIISSIDFDEYPVEERVINLEYEERFDSWMKWINWERRNPLTTANKPLLHSRIVYAFRRALMSMRGDEIMWLAYSNYLRFDANKPDDAEIVLKQARKFCPMSLTVVLAAVDLKEGRGGDLETIRPCLDDFITFSENKLNELKREIIGKARKPSDPDDDDLVFENALIDKDLKEIEEYLKVQRSFNGAQVRLLEIARRLDGLTAGRTVFAAARKSNHVTSAIFSAAASLEFRIRKDASIATKIYELGLNRFPTDWNFSREYLKFLLALNDDGNVRALFERIVASIEGFRSTHSREIIELNEDPMVIKGIWQDFYEFEKEIGDWQSVAKLEDRMRSAFPDEVDFKAENFFMSRLELSEWTESSSTNDSTGPSHEFSMPKVKAKSAETGLFHLSELLFNLLVKINETVPKYDGPLIDTSRFISFIDRVTLPSSERITEKESSRPANSRSTQSQPQSQLRQRKRRDQADDEDNNRRDQHRKQARAASSIFEERRRH